MGFFWIIIGLAYIVYRLWKEAADGDGSSTILLLAIGGFVLLAISIYGLQSSSNQFVQFLCVLPILALIGYGFFAIIRFELRQWKERDLFEAASPHKDLINTELYNEIYRLPISEDISEKCRTEIHYACRCGRLPELFDVQQVLRDLVDKNPSVRDAHEKLIELGVVFPKEESYTTEEMQSWFRKVDTPELRHELDRLGVDYSLYDFKSDRG